MATRASRKLLGSLKGRYYATQTATAQSEAGTQLPKQGPKLTKLPNGLLVASLENYSPVSKVAVVVNAGSRFETGDNLGITHFLRVAAGLSTKDSSQFGITRNIQQIGGNLTCTSTREYMYYNIDCTRDNVDTAVKFLKEITTSPAFKPWEVNDIQGRLTVDLAMLQGEPNVQLFELLHQAAFRNTLGHSLYAPEFMVGKYSSEQLMHFVKSYYTSGRMALVGVGVDHDYLVGEGNKFTPFSSSGTPAEKAVYHGGEERQNTGGSLAYAAVAVEGPSLAAKEILHAGVLQNVMGAGPFVKYSSNTAVSRLGQAVSQATTQPFAVSCINANYTDGGIFGFHAISQPGEIGGVLRAAFNQFATVTKGLTEQEVARAKKQLKTTIAMFYETSHNVIIDFAEQGLGHDQITSLEDINKYIDAITTTDVTNVAKRIVNGKQSMAAVGNLSGMPYLDQLYK